MRYARYLYLFAAAAVTLNGCGRKDKEAQTPYGSPAEVAAYLQKARPFIHQVSAYEVELHGKVGTSGQASGQNLSAAMEAIKPRLQESLRQFEQIDPPALMAPFHRDMKKLMVTRLEAYDNTIKGRQLELASGDTTLYKKAEQQLMEANQISLQLNEQIRQINQAIQQAAASSPAAR
jgi:uncharacterized phage infection (PIP) family protein YhgE